MIRKLFPILLILFLATNSFAQEVIVGFEDKDLPVLNEELRGLDISNQIKANEKLDLHDKKIENLATPTADDDGATKGYVDVRVPAGIIVMWSGTIATIPTGWALCDGNNGTPNLVDRFIVCAKQDDSGTAKTNVTGSLTQTGGSATHPHGAGTYVSPTTGSHTLTTAQIPSHRHRMYQLTGDVSDFLGGSVAGYGLNHAASGTAVGYTTSAGSGGGHTHSGGSVTGTSASASSLGPYYALAYIMKL